MTDTRTENWIEEDGSQHIATCDGTFACDDCQGNGGAGGTVGDDCEGCGGEVWFRCEGCA